MKITLKLVCFFVLLLLSFPSSVRATVLLTADEVGNLMVRNSLDIQLAFYEARVAQTAVGESLSAYDAFLTASAGVRDNEKGRTSLLYGTDSLDNDYSLGLSQQLPSGTSIELAATQERDWTNYPSLTHETAVSLNVEQTLGRNFFGRVDRTKVKVSRQQAAVAMDISLGSVERHIAMALDAYWDLVFAQDMLLIQESMVDQAQRLFEAQKDKLGSGLAEEGDVAAAEANFVSQQSDLLLARDAVASRQSVLKEILNIEEDSPALQATESLLALEQELDEKASLQSAFQLRRDFQAAVKEVEMRDLSLVIRRDQAYPEINLKATFTRNGLGRDFDDAWDQASAQTQDELFLGLEVRMALNNTEAQAHLEKARLEKAMTLLKVKKIERRIVLDVFDQVRTCRVLFKAATEEQKSAALQEKKLNAEQKKFGYARSSIDIIIRYQQDLLAARLKAARAALRHRLSLVALAQKEGQLLSRYNVSTSMKEVSREAR